MNKDWIFKIDESICDLRTVGILIRDGNEYALSGGHVKIGETTMDGLVREYREETGAEIQVGKLLWKPRAVEPVLTNCRRGIMWYFFPALSHNCE